MHTDPAGHPTKAVIAPHAVPPLSTPGAPAGKPKVIFVGPDPGGQGGMATVCQTLLSSALAERYDLRMISSHSVGSRAHRLRVFLHAWRQLRRALRDRPPAVVHVHAASRGSLLRKAFLVSTAHRRARIVLHVHTGSGEISEFAERLGPLRRRLLRRWMSRADVLVSASRAGAAEMQSSFGLPTAIIVNNPLPTAVPTFENGAGHGDRTRVLYLGGFDNPVKGGPVLIEATGIARKTLEGLDVTFAGSGTPPPEVARAGTWVGWLSGEDKAEALRAADIVVFPSTSEGLPVALLEAMAYGKAVIATQVGAIPEVVSDGRQGLLVPSGDPDALAAKMVELSRDPALRAALGGAARERAGDFSIDRVVDQLDLLYRRMLGTEGAGPRG